MPLKKDTLKRRFKADFIKIQGFINEFDPCGLIASGAPVDEYEHLTTSVLQAVYHGQTRVEIKKLLLHELEHYYGMSGVTTLAEPFDAQFDKVLDTIV